MVDLAPGAGIVLTKDSATNTLRISVDDINALLAAGRIYATTAEGIAATVDGDYFFVAEVGADTLPLYRKDAEVATDQDFALSSAALEAAAVADAEAARDAAAASATTALTAVAPKKTYLAPLASSRVVNAITDRFTRDATVNSKHGGQSGQFGTVENVFSEYAFDTWGLPNLMRIHGAGADSTNSTRPRGGFSVTAADLADAGLVPDDVSPPVFSVRGLRILADELNQNVNSTTVGQMYVVLRYAGSGGSLDISTSTSTDVVFVNTEATPNATLGIAAAATDPDWAGTSAAITYTAGVSKIFERENVPLLATYDGQALTGVMVIFIGRVLAAGISHIDVSAALVPGATVSLTESYLNRPDDQPDALIEASALSPDIAGQLTGGPVEAVRDGEYVYARTRWSDSLDKVARIHAGFAASSSSSGTLDHLGVRLIAADTSASDVPDAFDSSTDVLSDGIDETVPFNFNGMWLGGNHSFLGLDWRVASHDKTAADIGSQWSDGTRTWTLAEITSAGRLGFMGPNSGTTDLWNFYIGDAAAGTLTHVSGATHTASIAKTSSVPATAMLYPFIADYSIETRMDGGDDLLTEGGSAVGDRLVFLERYKIPNPARVMAYLQANVGATLAAAIAATPSQVEISTAHSVGRSGRFEKTSSRIILQEVDPGQYGGAQPRALTVPAGGALIAYVPRVDPFGAYDFAAGEDITANSSQIEFAAADWSDPANPPSRAIMIATDGSDPVFGLLLGISEKAGLGVPAVRSARVDTAFRISDVNKIYPYVDDDHTANLTAGSFSEVVDFVGVFDPAANPDFVCAATFEQLGATSLYAYSIQALDRVWIAIDPALANLPVTLDRASAGVTLHSTVAGSRGICASFPAGGGELEVTFG